MLSIPFLDNNPIAWAEYHRLRRTNHMSAAGRMGFALLYMVIILIAFSPYVYYITPDRVWWLAVMAVVVFGFQFYVTLRTAAVITSAPLPQTELLTVTPIGRWRLVVGKWWGGLKAVWAWHMLAAIPKAGLSLGVMGYMHLIYDVHTLPFMRGWIGFVGRPYGISAYASYQLSLFPMGWLVLTVIITSVVFSILDGALLVSMSIALGRFFRSGNFWQLTVAKTSLLILAIVLSFAVGYALLWHGSLFYIYQFPYSHVRALRHFLYAHILALGTFIDGGVMLNAIILNPGGRGTVESECWWFGVCEHSLSISWRRRSLYYLIRELLSAGYGMLLHIALTVGMLGLAVRRHP